VPITYLEMDLTRLASVQACASQFLMLSGRLDVLMCNAGIMAVDPAVTEDGYELQFQVNHLGHALLIKRLLPLLNATADQPGADVRIINMASLAYMQAPRQGIDFETLQTDQAYLGSRWISSLAKWTRYGEAKLANLLYPIELAKRYPKILSVSVHPGIIMTGLFDGVSFFSKLPVLLASTGSRTSVEEGPYQQLWAATADRSSIQNGAYYEPTGVLVNKKTKAARDDALARKLWDWSQEQLKDFN
jgi:NAD(P)-dependent dehydrogenase (short-subunit alcohol dehydrogenase family)